MIRRRIVLVYWVVAIAFFLPGATYAYIDPATTTYIIQIITALVVTLGVSLSVFLYRFRMISAKIRFGLYGLAYRLRGKRRGTEGRFAGEITQSAEGFRLSDSNQRFPESGERFTLPGYVLPGATRPPTDEEMIALGEPVGLRRIERKDSGSYTPGRRGYGGRLRAILPTTLAVCLSFILIGCIDLAAQNAMDMPFRISEAVPVIVICFAVCFAFILFVLPLFRGAVFEMLLSLAAAALIAGYIQGNYLNIGLGELTGDEIAWNAHSAMMAVSAVFWIGVVAAVFLLRRFARPVWRGLTVFIPFLLIIIQGVALTSALTTPGQDAGGTGFAGADSGEALSIAGINELSPDQNTMIFVLDRLDEEFVDEMVTIDPGFFDGLDGFTKFNDNISYAVSTFPSATGMLTGHRFYFEGPVGDYFDYAWANAKMMREMKARGVDIKLYMQSGYTYSRIEQLQGIASNIRVPEYDFSPRIALIKLLKLSAFRYAPMPAKPVFWLSPTEFADTISSTAASSPYVTHDMAFYEMLTTQRLKTTDEPSTFFYYHLLGAHDPIIMDENIQPSNDSTPARQGMGAFKIVYEYIDQLKRLGLYEDATIIITGDHGQLQGDAVFRPALTGLFVKPSGSYGTPLTYSDAPVCPDQLTATVLTSMFGEAGDFGPTYFDIKAGDPVVREYISDLKQYVITGDGRDFSNWEYVGTLENKSDW